MEETLKRTVSGLTPILSSQPGFISCEVIQASDTKTITICHWHSREAADAAVQVAASWARENKAVLLVEEYIGEVHYSSDGNGESSEPRS